MQTDKKTQNDLKKGTNLAAHSQGNLLTYAGIKYIEKKKKAGIPTFAGYGSPMNTVDMEKTIQGKNKDKMIWYNPSHGFFGDLIESGVDVIGNDYGVQTGISKQAQKFQESHKDLNIYMHSQGNAITVQGAKTSRKNGHTYFSYGSPLSDKKVKSIFYNKIKNHYKTGKMTIQKNEGDYVAHPLNILNSDTWSKPGHATENYGAAKLLKYKESSNEK